MFAISSGTVNVICGLSVMLVVNYGKHVVPFEVLMRLVMRQLYYWFIC